MRKMKDSGVEWIKEIPMTWNVIPNKHLMKKVKTIRDKYLGEDVLSLTMRGVIVRDLDNPTGKMPATFDGYQYVEAGNLLMCLFDIDVTPRCIGLINNNGVCSPAYSQFKLNSIANADYYYYYYLNMDYTKELLHLAKNLRHSLTEEQLGLIPTVVPPLEIQEKIAMGLKVKISQVDSLISNVQSQIEKLKSYKQSLITEVVTKGLNPNVQKKDSGVEWIREIPEHWDISKVSMFYDVTLGKALQPEPKNDTDSYENYLCAANLGNNTLNLDSLKQMWFSENDRKQYEVRRGDLIVVEGGDVGSCDIIKQDVSNLYIQNAVHRVRSKTNFMLEYLRYSLMMAKSQGYISLICNKATIAHFTKDKFTSMPLLVVPVSEQREIVVFLDKKCIQIEHLIAIKQSKIEKLEQYKRSIIYEYVTGKKEVS